MENYIVLLLSVVLVIATYLVLSHHYDHLLSKKDELFNENAQNQRIQFHSCIKQCNLITEFTKETFGSVREIYENNLQKLHANGMNRVETHNHVYKEIMECNQHCILLQSELEKCNQSLTNLRTELQILVNRESLNKAKIHRIARNLEIASSQAIKNDMEVNNGIQLKSCWVVITTIAITVMAIWLQKKKQAAVTACENTIKRLTDENFDKLKRQEHKYKDELEKLTLQLEKVEEELKDELEKKQTSSEDIESQEVDELQSQVQSLESQLGKMRDEAIFKEQELHKKLEEIETKYMFDLREKEDELSEKSAEHSLMTTNLKSELKRCRQLVQHHKNECEAERKNVENVRKKNTSLHHQLRNLEDKYKRERSDFVLVLEEKVNQDEQIVKMKKLETELKSKLQELHEEKVTLQISFSDYRSSVEKKIKSYKDRLSEGNRNLLQLEKELKETDSKKEYFHKEIKHLEIELKAKTQEMERQEESLQESRQNCVELQVILQQKECELICEKRRLNYKMRDIEHKMISIRAEKEKLEAALESKCSSKTRKKSKASTSPLAISQMPPCRKSVAPVQMESSLEEELEQIWKLFQEKCEKIRSKLCKELADERTHLLIMKVEIDKIRHDNAKLKRRLRNSEKRETKKVESNAALKKHTSLLSLNVSQEDITFTMSPNFLTALTPTHTPPRKSSLTF